MPPPTAGPPCCSTARTAVSFFCSPRVTSARCAAHACTASDVSVWRVQHRLRSVDQGEQRIQVLACVDGQRAGAGHEPGDLRPEPADGGVGLVDDRLQILARDRLQAPVRRVQQRVESGGTDTRSARITSPSCSGGESLRGSSATYCSPTAD